MVEKRVIVTNTEGLHARPATDFADLAGRQPVVVTIRKDGSASQQADSVLGLMMLGVACGDAVTLSAEGEGAEQAITQLASLLDGAH
ncbi:HPr family phosphocarrier protein [Isoptericola halotolerans]|uniref:HPr family phosphocarrier protein n=1 Tax=Isoptericola halotolerans TaxID=300560 RepID=UPI00388E608D